MVYGNDLLPNWPNIGDDNEMKEWIILLLFSFWIAPRQIKPPEEKMQHGNIDDIMHDIP